MILAIDLPPFLKVEEGQVEGENHDRCVDEDHSSCQGERHQEGHNTEYQKAKEDEKNGDRSSLGQISPKPLIRFFLGFLEQKVKRKNGEDS